MSGTAASRPVEAKSLNPVASSVTIIRPGANDFQPPPPKLSHGFASAVAFRSSLLT
jgi:hypothetical protein